MKAKLKIFRILLAIFLIIIIAQFFITKLFLSLSVKHAVNQFGPTIIGVPVSVEDVSVGFFFNRVEIKNLRVGNPEGYKNDHLLDIDTIDVKISLTSLLRDVKIVDHIYISGIDFLYETKINKTNLGDLLAILSNSEAEAQAGAQPETPAPESEPQPEQPAETTEAQSPSQPLKFIVKKLDVEQSKASICVTQFGGVGAPIPLPPLHLKDIGQDENGISISGLSIKVLTSFSTSIATGIKDLGLGIGSGVKELGTGVKDLGTGVFEGVKGLFDKKDN